MLSFAEEIIEFLYLYQQSYLFTIHFLLLCLFSTLYFFVCWKELELTAREENPLTSRCHSTIPKQGYQKYVK